MVSELLDDVPIVQLRVTYQCPTRICVRYFTDTYQ